MEGDTDGHFKYPVARRDDSVEYEYFGTKIKDPYRWLEDPDSDETKQFVLAQNEISLPYINSCSAKARIQERLTEMWDYPKYSTPGRAGPRYYHFMNTGVQNQSALYLQNSLNGPSQVFFDPNTLSPDGSSSYSLLHLILYVKVDSVIDSLYGPNLFSGTISLNTYNFSEDGEIFAYALSEAGSDWASIRFKKVSTGEEYPEVLKRVKFSGIEWTHDNVGVFYSKYPETDSKADGTETVSMDSNKVFYHRVGTEQSEDILVAEFPDEPKWLLGFNLSDCGRYLFITPVKECKENLLFFFDLNSLGPEGIVGKVPLTPIVTKFEADYSYVANTGSKVLFRTNKNAPIYQIIEVDLEHPEESNWRSFIPEHESDVLDSAATVNKDKLVLCYMRDVCSVLQLHDLNTGAKLQDFPLDVGQVLSLSARRKYDEMFFKFDSFLEPGTIYRVDFNSPAPWKADLYWKADVKGFNKDDFVAKQVFFTSKDGTRVPMFIVHRKDFVQDGTAPAILYGYGGFNVSLQPSFSLTFLSFIQSFHGVFAEANARGGGEYGEKWHNEGRLLKKQNCYDDFQVAAEYLINEKYTQAKKLTIEGYSNGGFTVGACLNQRPDLFGAGIAGVGVLDLMRFHKFTVGYLWTSDYGNPEENEDQFRNLLKLSPLHCIPSADSLPGNTEQYPALLLLTADHDDRVVPLHSLKFIAELQHVHGHNPKQTNPLIIRVETKAGHGGGKPTKKRIEEIADSLAFIMNALKLEYRGDEN
ncbi:unnamed protein product [Notodromas monacha]|uniref:Prolyl endopeptidase n=1 Tax=Notodromas monacha TaxID=399045 RepID=A0A7R9GAP4_9CRUS|nr:unnamed protein product [Notodromas monacha]CAG0914209.1 unnamed protein product [Notodromas monacha]